MIVKGFVLVFYMRSRISMRECVRALLRPSVRPSNKHELKSCFSTVFD